MRVARSSESSGSLDSLDAADTGGLRLGLRSGVLIVHPDQLSGSEQQRRVQWRLPGQLEPLPGVERPRLPGVWPQSVWHTGTLHLTLP